MTLSDQEINELINRIKTEKDVELIRNLKEKILTANEGMIIKIASKLTEDKSFFNDLYQDGCIALLKAIDKFDPSQGVKFQTFAYTVIENDLKRAKKEEDKQIQIPEYMISNLTKILKAETKLKDELNRDPNAEEVAKETGFTVEQIIEYRNYAFNIAHIDDDDCHNEHHHTIESLVDSHQKNPEDELEEEEATEALYEGLSQLSDIEREVLLSYYGYNREKKTIVELSKEFNLTTDRIRGILRRAEKALNEFMED